MLSLLAALAVAGAAAQVKTVDLPAVPALPAARTVLSLADAVKAESPGLSAQAAVSLAAEGVARPVLLPALPRGAALAARVQAAHADPAAGPALRRALEPFRARAARALAQGGRQAWASVFDGGRAEPYPVLETNFPGMLYAYGDPAAIRVGKTYYVVSTSNNAPDAGPIVRSKDLRSWEPAGFLFPRGRRPAWQDADAERFDLWAPEIHRVGRKFVAYYTARDRTGHLVIGAASARRPEGPWTDLGRPLIQDPRVGLIDAHQFFDRSAGKRYIYWKKDGNQPHIREKTTIYVSELSADGLSLVGPRREVLENDQEWEDDLVEGPWVVKRGGWYYVFYSGNNYTTPRYGMSVARARSPLGPFEKSPARLLMSGALFDGPGHCSVVKGPGGEDLLVYHAYRPGKAGYRKDRLMRIEPLAWKNGWPRLASGFAGGAPPLP